MLDGRVKTLHPAVHGGLLARRDVEEHMTAIAEQGIETIDLVAVNLYPFRETAARPNVHPDAVIEQIDIGGPSMLRSAAKNFPSVFAVVDPADYARVLAALQAGDDDIDLRRVLAAKVFAHTARLRRGDRQLVRRAARRAVPRADHALVRPRADAPLRREPGTARGVLRRALGAAGSRALEQRGGKELSFNNLLDLEGALLATDPFAGEMLLRDREAHDALRPRRRDVGARRVSQGARVRPCLRVRLRHRVHGTGRCRGGRSGVEPVRRVHRGAGVHARTRSRSLGRKKNLRVLDGTARWSPNALDFKRVRGGVLAQERAPNVIDDAAWQVVTRAPPDGRRAPEHAVRVAGGGVA